MHLVIGLFIYLLSCFRSGTYYSINRKIKIKYITNL